MGIYIIDSVVGYLCVRYGGLYCRSQSAAVPVWAGKVVRIGPGSITDYPPVYFSFPPECVFFGFEHHKSSPFPECQTVPVPVKWPYSVSGNCLKGIETGNRKITQYIHAACKHYICPA